MTTTGRRVAAGSLLLVGFLALLYVADVAMASGKVPRGTEVDGVGIGGRSRAEARRLLAARLTTPKTVTLTLPGGGEPVTLDAAAAGLSVDLDLTVDAARNEALNPFTRVTSMFAKHAVDPVPVVDVAKLNKAVEAWAKKVDHGAREGAVRFDGVTPVPVPPRAGRSVEVDRTGAAVARAWLAEETAEAVVLTDPVKTTDADVNAAVDAIARPAVAAPITLTAPRKSVTMTRSQIAAVLRIDTDPDGRITPKIDPKKVATVLETTLKPVETPPQNAKITLGPKDTILFGPSAPGTKVDRDALAEALLAVVTQPSPRFVTLTVVESEPAITTAKAKALGINEKVGEFTTYHPCCRPRVRNIHLMADIVNNAVVLPGETFSLNGYVGERDRARGFVEAPMILDGKFVPSVGGGVSQFATTMFNAVFFGGFQDVHHKAHSYYISRYPPGREATVSSPTPDLKWRNDSPYGVLVTTSYTERSITVTFWSTKRYDIESITGQRYRIRGFGTEYDSSPTCENSRGVQGFDIDVWRVFKQGGKEIKREKFHTRYLPEPNFVCRR